ncbi:MAG TPA: hypothetical protein VGF69_12385 [Thermoanaerobaculia bacterium]|jgi:hypothetical protein
MTRFRWFVALAIVLVIAIPIVAAMFRGRGVGSVTIATRMLVLRIVLGVVFTLLGIIGSVLPIMQGWIFFLLAALVIFPQSKFAMKVMAKAEPKMPRLCGWLRRLGIGERNESEETGGQA